MTFEKKKKGKAYLRSSKFPVRSGRNRPGPTQ